MLRGRFFNKAIKIEQYDKKKKTSINIVVAI